MPRGHPTFLRLVASSGKNSDGSKTGSNRRPAFKTSVCRPAGMTPRVFQDWTVCAGNPSRVAIGRTPPNLSMMRSTGVMDRICTQSEFDVNSFCGLTSDDDSSHNEYMGKTVAKQLKALRKQTGLTVRELAAELDMPYTTYSNYENRYKKPYLPVELCRKLAPIFARHGIGVHTIDALCGLTPSQPLTDDEHELLRVYLALSQDAKAAVLGHARALGSVLEEHQGSTIRRSS